mgnify:CR=1 FL=1
METSGNRWSSKCKTFKRGTTDSDMLDSKEKVIIRVNKVRVQPEAGVEKRDWHDHLGPFQQGLCVSFLWKYNTRRGKATHHKYTTR